jgi:DNA processing protein
LKVLSKKRRDRRVMGKGDKPVISTYATKEMLGRSLNDIENLYAAKTLFASGPMEIPLPRPRVSIVGTRQASETGLKNAKLIAEAMTKKGVVIVSGLAKGIDTAAHRAAIESGGRTIAVLGTPLDRAYPRENADLQSEIMKNHLAISQFRVGQPVTRSNFPIRNRIMALISDATIIVEAGEQSGSLSQGWETLRLGRFLFLWKSLFEAKLSWPDEMVKFGAMKLSDIKDIFEFLPSNRSVLEVVA